MFQPCNFPLPRLLEIHQEQRQRSRVSRQRAVDGRRMSPGTSDYLDRYDAAIEVLIKKAIDIQLHHPEVLENPQ